MITRCHSATIACTPAGLPRGAEEVWEVPFTGPIEEGALGGLEQAERLLEEVVLSLSRIS